ncbi:MAG: c-type cytochrome [Acidobacteria bacterium]|nr:c-type cytochrome [Acidobacteriota bacterium]
MVAAIGLMAQTSPQPPPQTPPTPTPAGPGGRGGRGTGGGGGGGGAYPARPPADPVILERGKALYSVNCAFCHGADARGATAPSLLRSALVLNDQNGELIAPVVQNGRPDRGMPKQGDLTTAQIAEIATFIHSFRVGGYDISRERPPSIVVGDARAGEAVFKAKCGACHSLTGDLKGFGARVTDPRQLQQTWLMPGGRPSTGSGQAGGRGGGENVTNVSPTTVTVTLPTGPKVEGRLRRIDDFNVTLTLADGTDRTFRRDGDTPAVEIHDPLTPHRNLLSTYTDEEIHNLTAFLVTVK